MWWYCIIWKKEGFDIVLSPVSKTMTSVANKKTLQNYEEQFVFYVNWGQMYFKQNKKIFWELSSYEPFRICESKAFRFHIENFKHLTYTSHEWISF